MTPERWLAARRQQLVVTIYALVAIVVFGSARWGWLAVVASLVGGWIGALPARRALLGETWGPAAYVAFLGRWIVAFLGPWIALMLAPSLLQRTAGPARLALGLLAAALLVGWLRHAPTVARWILGARPLATLRPDLTMACEELVERSALPGADIDLVSVRGGRVVNAVALPSQARPGVLVTGSLLQTLSGPELVAIVAHELGHLEDYQAGKLRRAARVGIALVLAGCLALPWLPLGVLGPFAAILWPVAVFAALALLARDRQPSELASDRRAVELTGDAATVESALVAVYAANRFPRRLAADLERAASHPSLARRIAAIRQLAVGGHSPDSGPGPQPLAVAGVSAGEWLVVEPTRLAWLVGVPAERAVEVDAHQLFELAQRVDRVEAGQLIELRLEPKGADAVLRTVDLGGTRRVHRLHARDIAALEPALQALEPLLAPLDRGLGPLRKALHRLVGLCAAVAGLTTGGGFLVVVLGCVTTLVARPQVLAAAGAAALLTAALGWWREGGDAAALLARGGVPLWLAGAGVAAMALALLGRPHPRPSTGRRTGRAGWVLAILAAVVVGIGLPLAALALDLSLWRIHQLAGDLPSLIALPAALAAAAFVHTGRRRSTVLALASLPGLVVASPPFRELLISDPLLRQVPAVTIETVAWQQARHPLEDWAWALELAPDGSAWAVSDGEEEWALHRSGEPVEKVTAHSLRLLGRGRGIAADHGPDGVARVRQLDLEGAVRYGPPWELPDFADFTGIGVVGDRWYLSGWGRAGAEARLASALLVPGSEVASDGWPRQRDDDGWIVEAQLGARMRLATVMTPGPFLLEWLAWTRLASDAERGLMPGSRVVDLARPQRQGLGSDLDHRVLPLAPDGPAAILVAGPRLVLGLIEANATDWRPLAEVGRLGPVAGRQDALVWVDGRDVVVQRLEPAYRWVLRDVVPAAAWALDVAATLEPTPTVAILIGRDEGAEVLVASW